MITRWLRHLLPGCCLLCDGPIDSGTDLDLCGHCREALPWNTSACRRCANPLPPISAAAGPDLCPDCRQRPPPFTKTVAPLVYSGFPRRWVTRLKDQMGMVEGRVLAELLADAAQASYACDGEARPDLLVPVPLTPLRLARRGHNQALTLARPVARRLGIPFLRMAVSRAGQGPRQRGLSRSERLGSPADAFRAHIAWDDAAPCVAIVDDVLTTGATAAALSRVLLDAGAREVHVLCPARTPRLRPVRSSPPVS